jgi:glycosyltransferase involved in cell wall biosynthesis
VKKILIISPHYPPSNLAAVHRSRLFAQHLPSFGWEPVILTVDEKYYEEKPDWNLHKLIPAGQRIEKVKAIKVTRPRLIGDIGLRAFYQLRRKALEIVKKENIDFVYIPIPSFYVSLIGPWLKKKTGVKFGIDYIDPWVHVFPGSDKKFSRHWWSTKIAKWLEPKALKTVSLITGVAEGYYEGVQERHPGLLKSCVFGAMPYGGEIMDHQTVKEMQIKPYLFEKEKGKVKLVYAGAMLPKAYEPLERIFKAIKNASEEFANIEFHFIGTGKMADDPNGYNIKPLAEKYGLWQKIVFEYPARIPYLDVLIHLEAATGVFILGSTEPHYTPSKVYQGVLAQKPILVVLHSESSAVKVIEGSKAGIVLAFDGEAGLDTVQNTFVSKLKEYVGYLQEFDLKNVEMEIFEQYSANAVTKKLVSLVEESCER